MPSLTDQLNIGRIGLFDGARNLLNGIPPISDTSISASGLGRVYNESTQISTIFSNSTCPFIVGAGLTVAIQFDISALGSGSYGGLISWSDTTTTNGFELRLGASPLNVPGVLVVCSASDYAVWANHLQVDAFPASAAYGMRFVVSIPADLSVSPTMRANGVESAMDYSLKSGTGTMTKSSSPIYLGGRADGVTKLNGAIYRADIWNRRLSSYEAKAWPGPIEADNPWKLFAPQRSPKFYSLPAIVAAPWIAPSRTAGQAVNRASTY